MISIGIAFETITPESAEYGDAENRGWYQEPTSYRRGDLRAALSTMRDHGYIEASSSPFFPRNAWWTAYGDPDVYTGEVENLSLHVRNATPSTMRRIHHILTQR